MGGAASSCALNFHVRRVNVVRNVGVCRRPERDAMIDVMCYTHREVLETLDANGDVVSHLPKKKGRWVVSPPPRFAGEARRLLPRSCRLLRRCLLLRSRLFVLLLIVVLFLVFVLFLFGLGRLRLLLLGALLLCDLVLQLLESLIARLEKGVAGVIEILEAHLLESRLD